MSEPTPSSSILSAEEETEPPSEEEEELDDDDDRRSSVSTSAGRSVSWVHPMVEAHVGDVGSGLFALEDLGIGTILVVWTGKIVDVAGALEIMKTEDRHYLLQIGDGFYQCPLQSVREPADWTNHSCDPNAGFGAASPICLTAMRAIRKGEEILFDYAMCETDPRFWEPMKCNCQSRACRKWITANDWKWYPQLHTKYKGFFSPHVQKRIDELRGDL